MIHPPYGWLPVAPPGHRVIVEKVDGWLGIIEEHDRIEALRTKYAPHHLNRVQLDMLHHGPQFAIVVPNDWSADA